MPKLQAEVLVLQQRPMHVCTPALSMHASWSTGMHLSRHLGALPGGQGENSGCHSIAALCYSEGLDMGTADVYVHFITLKHVRCPFKQQCRLGHSLQPSSCTSLWPGTHNKHPPHS